MAPDGPPTDRQAPQHHPAQMPGGEAAPRPRPKKSGLWKVIALAVIFIILIAFLASPWLPMLVDRLTGHGRSYPESAHFWVNRTIGVDVAGGGVIDLRVRVPMPEDIGNGSGLMQDRQVTDPDPLPLLDASGGTNWMVWEGSSVRSYVVTIGYEFEARLVWWDITKDSSGTPAEVPQATRAQYLGDEWKIVPSDPTVAQLSASITAGEPTVYGRLRAIYDYLNENIQYESTRAGTPKDCLQTLSDRSGDCDDQSILFCSLARAAGVPAWLEFGSLYDSGSRAWGAHAWVRAFMLAGADAGWANIDVVNQEFLIRPANRYTEWVDDGNGTDLQAYYKYINYSYFGPAPQLTVDDRLSGNLVPSSATIYVPAMGRPSTPWPEPLAVVLVVAAPALAIKVVLSKRKRKDS
ncbi:MAG: transglutaminase domain-containing protein [Euryarchaeota archaeon]|nr:transglutaminase domain-containing protein [Euryarchaeota archaeon]